MYSSSELFQLSWEGYFGLISLQGNKGNKHQNNTRVSTETVCHKSTYITYISYMT